MATRHWQRIESGEANPTLYTLVRVAVVLNVGVSELFLALPKR